MRIKNIETCMNRTDYSGKIYLLCDMKKKQISNQSFVNTFLK